MLKGHSRFASPRDGNTKIVVDNTAAKVSRARVSPTRPHIGNFGIRSASNAAVVCAPTTGISLRPPRPESAGAASKVERRAWAARSLRAMKRLLLLVLVFSLAACSSGRAASSGGGGGRSTSDPRVRSFVGGPLPTAPAGGQWIRHMTQLPTGATPKVIYYQFAFPS